MLLASLYGYGFLLILAAIVIAIINAEELKDMDDMIDMENERWMRERNAHETPNDKSSAA